MDWLQAHLIVDQHQALLVEILFNQLGALSTTLVDAEDQPLLEPKLGEMPIWKRTKVTGLFSADIDPDHLRQQINQTLNHDLSQNLSLEALADQAWERLWLERFKPMQFGQRLWICPTGYELDRTNKIVIDLDPGLAFGTGTHPTTALCLTWLEQLDLKNKTLIDYGCGSGILAIAALKLGAKKVIAIDNDPQALIATTDNAIKNKVMEHLVVQNINDKITLKADILIANILSTILIKLQPLFSTLLKDKGKIALSGILQEQGGDIINIYQPLFDLKITKENKDWLLLVGNKKC